MSKEIREALGIVKPDYDQLMKIVSCKAIVMNAYGTRRKTVRIPVEDMEKYMGLVEAEIFNSKEKNLRNKSYYELKLTDKGKDIGERLWNEGTVVPLSA
jgi:hypothetical protein